MEVLKQLAIILGITLLGEAIAAVLPFALPASVIAMVVLFILLLTGAIQVKTIEETGDFFLKNMSLFFLPAAVGILEHTALLSKTLVPFLLVCVITLVLTFGATAWTVLAVRRVQARILQKKQGGGSAHVE